MKIKERIKKYLTSLMAFAMIITLIPSSPIRATGETYKKITSEQELTTGKYVMVVDTGDAPTVLDGTWVLADKPSINSETIDNPAANLVWDLTVEETNNTVKLADSNGKYIAPLTGNNNGIKEGEYSWKYVFENGKFTFNGQGSDTTIYASNKGSEGKFRSYKTSTVTGNPNGYPSEFTLYKLTDGGSVEDTVAAPMANPQAGEVASGTTITLTTTTQGASIYYTLDGTTPTTNSTLYTNTTKPVITQTSTLKAIAVLGDKTSAVQTLSYTVPVVEPEAPLKDGDHVVIYAPAYNKALSTVYNGFYNSGVDVALTNGKLTGYGNTEVWNVIANDDGTYSFAYDGKKLAMGDSFSSMTLGEKNDKWELIQNDNGTYYLKNVVRKVYIEWFADKDNWSGYGTIASGNEGMFELQFYHAEAEPQAPLKDGDQVVIYAPAFNKALSTVYNGFYNSGVDVALTNGKLTGYGNTEVWNVIANDDGTFSFAYDGKKLAMGDSFSSMTLGEKNDKWELIQNDNGTYYLKNVARKVYIEWFADKDNWSGYGTIASGNEGMFELQFYHAEAEPQAPIQDGDNVVIYAPAYNMSLSSLKVSTYYNKGVEITVDGDSLTGYEQSEVWKVIANDDGTFSFAQNGKNIGMADTNSSMELGAVNDKWELIDLGDGTFNLRNTVRKNYMEWYASKNNWSTYDSNSAATDDQYKLTFFKVTNSEDTDEIEGLAVESAPKNNASVKAGQIITLKAAKGMDVYFTMNTNGIAPADPTVDETLKYANPIAVEKTPEKGKPIIVKAVAYNPETKETGTVYTFTFKAPMDIEDYDLFFGQMHAHTNISDGTGTVDQAYEHASNVANLDFLAITDHSNWMEGQAGLPATGTTHLGDTNAQEVNSAWKKGHDSANAITDDKFVGLYGFEMTWSGGNPGHINTFNSLGFENRNAAPYKKGDNYQVLEAYFNTLNENPETISEFNHPGDTFGDFMDFALYSPVTDNQMTLVEVGNGEGPIGGSGYFPSYSYYTRALDKGWHVAPTNNQDNHKGNWGDANTARSVVLAENLTQEAIYDAMKNYRVYATEDNDLSILYTLNGNAMGSILDVQDNINIYAAIKDPTDTQGTTKVEVIVNGGQVLASKTFTGGSAEVTFDNLSTNYSYYYLRITQADKNIAVTAPVWTGEGVNAGVNDTKSDLEMPIKGDTVNISSQVYNNLSSEMKVTSLTYTIEGQNEPFHVADLTNIGNNGVVGMRSAVTYKFAYDVKTAGSFNVNVEMKAVIDGEEYIFTDVLKLAVSDSSIATKVLVDGSHYNDYVSGYYADNFGNLISLGAKNNIQVKIVQPNEKVTDEMLKDVSMFVVPAPAKKNQDNGATPQVFEDEFVNVVKRFVENGGTLVTTGLADYQDSSAVYSSYTQVNKLLTGVGSSMTLHDDEVVDPVENGGQSYRLYFDDFNTNTTNEFAQSLLSGIKESGLTYSAYSGCSVDEGDGVALVYGHETTYSINSKAPSQGHDKPVLGSDAPYDENTAVVKKGDVVGLAYEPVAKGHVIVGGTVFLSSFEINVEDMAYANGIIAENLLNLVKKEPVISTIEEARAGEFGDVFTVIGTVANGTYETGNAFFDTIYIQDEKGNGINVFPINDPTIKRGMRVQVTGSISEYIGDKQLSAISVTVLDGTNDVVVTDVTTAEANDYETNFGKLVHVSGKVLSVRKDLAGVIDSIVVQDASGESCRLFIDGYIDYSDKTSEKLEDFVTVGSTIEGMGFVSHDAEGNRLRVRDRSEIKAVKAEEFSVTATIENGTLEGEKVAYAGNDYTATLVANKGYELCESIIVKVDGKALDNTNYTYDAKTGKLVILGNAVTGNIELIATMEKTLVNPVEPTDPQNPNNPTNPENPDTSDNANIMMWISIALICIAVLSFSIYKKTKKESR